MKIKLFNGRLIDLEARNISHVKCHVLTLDGILITWMWNHQGYNAYIKMPRTIGKYKPWYKRQMIYEQEP